MASRIASKSGETVEPTVRGAMTPKRRAELMLAYGGRCARCGEKIMKPGWVANHIVPLALGGPDELGNLEPLHKACDGEITPKDISRIAKTKRLIKKDVGQAREPSRLQSRGFSTTLRKRMDGTVVAREERR